MVIVIVILFLIVCGVYAGRRTRFASSRPRVELFPAPPKPIESPEHHALDKELIKSKKSCGGCEDLQASLVETATAWLERIKQGSIRPIPELPTYVDCELCNLLLESWKRYFDVVETICIFLDTGKLPDIPENINTDCEGCLEIQAKMQSHNAKVRKEAQCLADLHGRPGQQVPQCQHVRSPSHVYEKVDGNCTECQKMYNMHRLYTIHLVAIINYMKRQSRNSI
jgi:hypothetical protein